MNCWLTSSGNGLLRRHPGLKPFRRKIWMPRLMLMWCSSLVTFSASRSSWHASQNNVNTLCECEQGVHRSEWVCVFIPSGYMYTSQMWTHFVNRVFTEVTGSVYSCQRSIHLTNRVGCSQEWNGRFSVTEYLFIPQGEILFQYSK